MFSREHKEKTNAKQVQTGIIRLNDGSKLGMAFWILSLLFILLVIVPINVIRQVRSKSEDTVAENMTLVLWAGWSVVFNFMRMAAGFAIWAGITMLDDTIFCPSLSSTGGIAALAFAFTLLDHGWRAYFLVEGAKFRPIMNPVESVASISTRKSRKLTVNVDNRAPPSGRYRKVPAEDQERQV